MHSFIVAGLGNRTTITRDLRLESAHFSLQWASPRVNQRPPSQRHDVAGQFWPNNRMDTTPPMPVRSGSRFRLAVTKLTECKRPHLARAAIAARWRLWLIQNSDTPRSPSGGQRQKTSQKQQNQ
jgi:hypothetical protein